ncbi:MAG: hypothetical protein H0U55_05790 [Rubrobacteraceae bacterium]|nr:hypothetical protein [Rubrobacteraceae bacterium]
MVWDACSERLQPFACERPQIKLCYSDDLGTSWSQTEVLSEERGNYFPTISNDRPICDGSCLGYRSRLDG